MDEVVGLRASVVNAALDLMTVLTEMSVELLQRVRQSADYVFPHAILPNAHNLTEPSIDIVRIEKANISLNTLDSKLASETKVTSNQRLAATPSSEVAPSTKAAKTKSTLRSPFPHHQIVDPQTVLVSKAASFVRTVLRDVNKGIHRRFQT